MVKFSLVGAKTASVFKNNNTNKINFFSRTAWHSWLKFYMEHKWDLCLQNFKIIKKIAELGHSIIIDL